MEKDNLRAFAIMALAIIIIALTTLKL